MANHQSIDEYRELPYKWSTAHEWLEAQCADGRMDFQDLMPILEQYVDADIIQDFFQEAMDEDDFFTPLLHEDQFTFKEDMEANGYEVEFYRGRNGYIGFAVRDYDDAEVMSCTEVICNVDQMGKGYVIYPRKYRAPREVE